MYMYIFLASLLTIFLLQQPVISIFQDLRYHKSVFCVFSIFLGRCRFNPLTSLINFDMKFILLFKKIC